MAQLYIVYKRGMCEFDLNFGILKLTERRVASPPPCFDQSVENKIIYSSLVGIELTIVELMVKHCAKASSINSFNIFTRFRKTL